MSAWDREFAPPTLAALGEGARRAFGLPAVNIGIKGDESHTYGGHRSRAWIYESGDGADDYTVQLPLDQGGNADWLAALDITLGTPERMKLVTGRVIDALKRHDPRLAAVREVFGTLDGRNVAGWDAAHNRTTTADTSHLWHLHLTIYRSRAGDDHSGVLAVLTGEDDEDMTPEELFAAGITTPNWDKDPRIAKGAATETLQFGTAVGTIAQRSYQAKLASESSDHKLDQVLANQAADATRDATALAAIKALTVATGADPAPILDAIREQGEATRQAVIAQHEADRASEISALRAELDARQRAQA